jgi:hypothetical protein
MNNLKQMSLALHNCNDTNGKLPPAVGYFPGNAQTNWGSAQWNAPAAHGTLQYMLLPYLEQDTIYNSVGWASWNSNSIVKTFIAPGDPTMPGSNLTWSNRGATSYASNWFVFQGDGNGGSNGAIPAIFPDGSSNTIVWLERYCICQSAQHIWAEDGQGAGPGANFYSPTYWQLTVPQLKPSISACDPWRVQGFASGGINVGLGDGSVRNVNAAISQGTWQAAMLPNDGVPLGSDW